MFPLLIIHPQVAFCENGILPSEHATMRIRVVMNYILNNRPPEIYILLDKHSKDHLFFTSSWTNQPNKRSMLQIQPDESCFIDHQLVSNKWNKAEFLPKKNASADLYPIHAVEGDSSSGYEIEPMLQLALDNWENQTGKRVQVVHLKEHDHYTCSIVFPHLRSHMTPQLKELMETCMVGGIVLDEHLSSLNVPVAHMIHRSWYEQPRLNRITALHYQVVYTKPYLNEFLDLGSDNVDHVSKMAQKKKEYSDLIDQFEASEYKTDIVFDPKKGNGVKLNVVSPWNRYCCISDATEFLGVPARNNPIGRTGIRGLGKWKHPYANRRVYVLFREEDEDKIVTQRLGKRLPHVNLPSTSLHWNQVQNVEAVCRTFLTKDSLDPDLFAEFKLMYCGYYPHPWNTEDAWMEVCIYEYQCQEAAAYLKAGSRWEKTSKLVAEDAMCFSLVDLH